MNRHTEFGTIVVYFFASLAFIAIALLFSMIIAFALPVIFTSEEASPFSGVWAPAQGQFGILPMFIGSLLLASLALLIAFPLAIAGACWLVSIGRGHFLQGINATLRFMATIPTVVYAFAAIFLLTPIIRQAMGGTGMGWISAAIMLSILILPTMILVIVSGIKLKLEECSLSGIALGFTRFELLVFFVLPNAKKSIFSATMLGFGRAIGDTLLPLMLAGNATQIPNHLTDSMRSLTAHMALVTANEVGGAAYNSLFVAGLLLLLISASITIIVKKLTQEKN